MNQQQFNALKELITDMKPELQPVVNKIEASPETTKGHYGDYMTLISGSSNGSKTAAQIIVLALIACKANEFGVNEAYKLLYPR
jgi:RNA binding exosome subunit